MIDEDYLWEVVVAAGAWGAGGGTWDDYRALEHAADAARVRMDEALRGDVRW